MSTWSRITVSCLVSLSNQPSAVIARTLYGKSFKYSFSRRHRIHMRVPSHFCDILTFLRIIALFFFFLLRFFFIDYLFHPDQTSRFFAQFHSKFPIILISFLLLFFSFFYSIRISFSLSVL